MQKRRNKPARPKLTSGVAIVVKDCMVCNERCNADFKKILAEYSKRVRCPICDKSFKLSRIEIAHAHKPGPDVKTGQWRVTYEVAKDAMTEVYIGAHTPELTSTAHTRCVKKAMPHWPTTAQAYRSAIPTAEELADKMIESGAHLKALDEIRGKLGDALTGLLKNVAGSSSEFGCPCAARVSSTLNEIADKFQKDEKESGI
jgi:hypothetical protein